MANVQPVTSVKLVLLGESAVGKSSIVLRYVQNTFKEFNETTIGAAFMTQTLIIGESNRTIKFEIWDTAGQERYHSLAPMYFRGANAAIIVYDIQSKESFNRAKSWVTEVNTTNKGSTIIALAGNKADKAESRQVTVKEAQDYAEENGLIFMETSAKSNLNITELFYAIALKLPVQQIGNDRSANNAVLRSEGANESSSSKMCCK